MEHNDKKQKKILFVITKSNFGGAQRYVYELATALPKEQFDVAVAFGGNGILKDKLQKAGITTFEVVSFERDISLIKEWYSLQELLSIIKTWGPDVLHLNSSKAAGLGSFVGRLLGVPRIIVTAHGWPFYEKRHVVWQILMWFFSYLTTIFAHEVIVVSKHDFNRHMMPFVGKKLMYIPTALPHIQFTDRETARSVLFSEAQRTAHRADLWVVSTGEFTRNKNLMRLLEAVRRVNETDGCKIFLSLMGEGEDRVLLKAYVREHHMENQVAFLGFVDDARTYLKAFDVFVLPSLKEGMPYGLLEAGAAGLSVIASDVGGIPDIVKNGETGILIDPTETKTLEGALREVAQNPSRMGDALSARVQNEFSLETMLEKTMQLYR